MSSIDHDKKRQIRIEIGLILSLIFVILIFIFSKRFSVQYHTEKKTKIYSEFLVEDIPVTRQGLPGKKPERPNVFIPVEEEIVPADEKLVELDFSSSYGQDGPPRIPEGDGFSIELLPRPIAEVIPEFPKEDIKNKIEGVVTLQIYVNEEGKVEEVKLLNNTTGSPRCAKAAQEAAFKNRFVPAKMKNKNVGMWILKKYSFSTPR